MKTPKIALWSFFWISLLSGHLTLAQAPNGGCQSDIRKAILYPEKVGCLEVAASGNEAMRLVANLHRMVNLTHLVLRGPWDRQHEKDLMQSLAAHPRLAHLTLEDNLMSRPPAGIEKLQGLRHLRVIGSPQLNYRQLIEGLAHLPHLESLDLIENELNHLPGNFNRLSRLQVLSIQGNEKLDFEKAIEVLAELPRLTEIHLPINQITNLPSNINLLKHLRVLDLRDNVLTNLHENLTSLQDLDTLQIEGNILVEPVEELSKAKGLSIRYLSLDNGLKPEERQLLQALFPQATIVEARHGTLPPDTLVAVTDQPLLPTLIDLEGEDLRVLSAAYLNYARIFNQPQFNYDFDSSLFMERYQDINYANVWRRQPGEEYHNIALEAYRRGNRKEVWFDFKRSGEDAWNVHINTQNPELNAFMGMKWVYIGDLSSRDFRKRYLRKKSWSDVRIYYNETAHNFTIELKHQNGFDRITAVPRLFDRSLPESKSQRTYLRRFERYQKVLQRRSERFHLQLQREHNHYKLAYHNRLNKAWSAFAATYFSEEEKDMTRKQWLNYYDQIVAREKDALARAKASRSNLIRRLEIEGFNLVSEGSDDYWHGVSRIECAFAYEDSSRVPETTILLMDAQRKQLRILEGNLGISAITAYVGDQAGCCFIVIARNGDLGVINSNQLAQNDFRRPGCHTFYLQRFRSELAAVSDIWTALGWQP